MGSDPLTTALLAGGGVLVRGELSHGMLDYAARSGRLVRVFPRVYVDAALADDPGVRRRAALRSAGSGAALSHLSALAEHELLPGNPAGLAGPDAQERTVHITVDRADRRRSTAGLLVHKSIGFRAEAPTVVERNGVPVVRPERALLGSWPLLASTERRAPVIAAVRSRRTTAERIRTELATAPRLAGRRELLHLIRLLESGCQSELEIWGLEHVFDHPSLPKSVAQFPLRVGSRVVYLDRAYPFERVGVELDGAAYHSSTTDRERDRRRDARLATLGWLTVRFTYRRLVTSPGEARAELREILAVRRQQLAG